MLLPSAGKQPECVCMVPTTEQHSKKGKTMGTMLSKQVSGCQEHREKAGGRVS